MPPIIQRVVVNGVKEARQRREKAEREEEEERRRLEKAFPALLQLGLTHPLQDLGHALSALGVECERDLKYVEESSLDVLLTPLREPLTQEDTDKIRRLRQRLVGEEEERVRGEEVEGKRREEQLRVAGDEADRLRKRAAEASQKKAAGDAARQRAADTRADAEREEERVLREDELSLKREEYEMKKRHEAARAVREQEKQRRYRPILEAEAAVGSAEKREAAAQSEAQARGAMQYKACVGKCNHRECRRAKKEHFGPDLCCFDPQVLAAGVARATEELAQARAAEDAARADPSFLESECLAKAEEEIHEAEAAAFAADKASKQRAAAASAKREAEARDKAAQEAAAAAKEDAAAAAKANADAGAASKREAEARESVEAHAAAVAKRKKAEAAAFKAFSDRLPLASAKVKAAEDKAVEAAGVAKRRRQAMLHAEEEERQRSQAEAEDKLRREAAAASAKREAEARDKAAQEAAAAAKEDATAAAKATADAGAASKREAEARESVEEHAAAVANRKKAGAAAFKAFSDRLPLASAKVKAAEDKAMEAAGVAATDAMAGASAGPHQATVALAGNVDSVEHEHVTAAELAAVIAMWQAVGDAGGEDKFTASKLSLGNPSDSDLREVYVCFFCAKIGWPAPSDSPAGGARARGQHDMSSYMSALYVVV